LCPYSWRVPKDLNGTYRLVPKIAMGPFASKFVQRPVKLRDGKWIPDDERQP